MPRETKKQHRAFFRHAFGCSAGLCGTVRKSKGARRKTARCCSETKNRSRKNAAAVRFQQPECGTNPHDTGAALSGRPCSKGPWRGANALQASLLAYGSSPWPSSQPVGPVTMVASARQIQRRLRAGFSPASLFSLPREGGHLRRYSLISMHIITRMNTEIKRELHFANRETPDFADPAGTQASSAFRAWATNSSRTPGYSPSPFRMHSVFVPRASSWDFQESSSSPAMSFTAWSPATIIRGAR